MRTLALGLLLAALAGADETVVALCDPYHQDLADALAEEPTLGQGDAPVVLVSGGAFSALLDRPTSLRYLERCGVRAVNLAHRDLREAAFSLGGLPGGLPPLVSANLSLTGRIAPWEPYVEVELGGESWAVVGLTVPSAAVALPGSGVDPGLVVHPPEESLEWVFERLDAERPVLVLADAPESTVAAWAERFPRVRAWIVSGRGGGDLAPEAGARVFRAPPGGQHLVVLPPAFAGGRIAHLSELVTEELPEDPFLADLLGSLERPLPSWKPTGDPAPPPPVVPPPLDSELFDSPTLVEPLEFTHSLMQPEREPLGLLGHGIDPADLNEAIIRGREFLWSYVRDNDILRGGRDLGGFKEHTIAVLALIHSGAHKVSDEIDERIRAYFERPLLFRRIYETSLKILAIDAYGDPHYFPLLNDLARCVLEAQYEDGSWGYNLTFKWVDAERDYAQVPEQLSWVPPRSSPLVGKGADLSTTQFALLALRSAHRRGMLVDRGAWERADTLFQERVMEDGGWRYALQGKSYGSMTCAGVSSTLIARWAKGVEDFVEDPRVHGGFAWLAENFSADAHPGTTPDLWYYYYLYSIERVGQLLGTPFIGEHEWFPLGVRALLQRQAADGGWRGKRGEADPRIATSLALLFLTRATHGMAEAPGRLVVVPRLGFRIIDTAGVVVAEGQVGDTVELPAGRYRLEVPHGSEVFSRELVVHGNELTRVVVEP